MWSFNGLLFWIALGWKWGVGESEDLGFYDWQTSHESSGYTSTWEMTTVPLLVPARRDVNECEDSTVCPAYSTCTDTWNSYYCTCKKGFLPSNGQTHFRGPGVECTDINECSLTPPVCGSYSTCTNLKGRYKCSCLHGFSSHKREPFISSKSDSFVCADIDECLNKHACPENSHCINSIGSYSCQCKLGFMSGDSGCEDINECSVTPTICGLNSVCTNFQGRYECSCLPGFSSQNENTSISATADNFTCTDIDECLDGNACPVNSHCVNSIGSYSCQCKTGFMSQNSICEDINECDQDPSPCGPNSVCSNTWGSFNCSCMVGFQPSPEDFWKDGSSICEKIPFKCKDDIVSDNEWAQRCQGRIAMEAENVSFCALMNATISILDDVCKDKNTTISPEVMFEHVAVVFENISTWPNFTKKEKSLLATVVLESTESTMLAALLKPSENTSQTAQTKFLDFESKVIKEECTDENASFNLKAKGDKLKIGCSTIKESEAGGITGVAFASFASMESVLDESYFQDPQDTLANPKRKLKMGSRVVGGVITGKKKDGFSEPIIYTLENIQPKQKSDKPICVSWSSDVEGGRWTSSGCVVLEASEMRTICSCNQMANLAIIMASGELTMEFSLHVISAVGMILSLVCLALAIATFLLCRAIRNHNTYLHLHLCICLFLAKILFLTGVDKTGNQIVCATIAGILHYLFLACFFWMLVEAVMLFLMVRNLKVVNYFSSRNIKIQNLCAFGYGLPALMVAISASAHPQGYGMHNRCWLNTETGFIWSFLGPICTIILINTILLTWTLCILRQKLSTVNAEVSKLKDNRLLTIKAFAQLFILGCSWVLGIFQIGPIARVMAYTFTVINSLQGTLIFLIHCLLNRQVREEYKRCLTRKTKPSSQPQTSGILLSSMPSTSQMD